MSIINYIGYIIVYLIIFLLSTIGGSIIIYYLKKIFHPSGPFSLDQAGVIERFLITICVLIGGWAWLFVPIITTIKILYLFKHYSNIQFFKLLNNTGLINQKINIKISFTLEILSSPTIAIVLGLLFRGT